MDAAAPDDGVVVDIVFEDAVLYLELANLADRPALNVACSFDPPVVDALGRDVSELRLFRHVTFLGPRRRVRTLLDSVFSYVAIERTASFAVTVEYERPGELRRATTLTHDLGIYRELAYRV
jgi:hypothetical protein